MGKDERNNPGEKAKRKKRFWMLERNQNQCRSWVSDRILEEEQRPVPLGLDHRF